MDEKYYCNICNLYIMLNEIENHIITQNHNHLKNQYLLELNKSETNKELTNNSSYHEWIENQ
jgi:hypothetical protein